MDDVVDLHRLDCHGGIDVYAIDRHNVILHTQKYHCFL